MQLSLTYAQLTSLQVLVRQHGSSVILAIQDQDVSSIELRVGLSERDPDFSQLGSLLLTQFETPGESKITEECLVCYAI